MIAKINGDTFENMLLIENAGLTNPNGFATPEDRTNIVNFSFTGFAFEFDLNGKLKRTIPTLPQVYGVTTKDSYLWAPAWTTPGQMIKYNLTKDKLEGVFPSSPLGNSIIIDKDDHVWVAGDVGVSVSDINGNLLATKTVGAHTNGLATIEPNPLTTDVFFVSYDDRLHRATFEQSASPLTPGGFRRFLPMIQKS